MKNDKEKHQLATMNEPTLQLLNKERERIKEAEKKESDAEAAKVRCRTCFKEIAPKRLCAGHGGSSGGGGASSENTSEEKASSGENKSLTKPDEIADSMDQMSGEFNSEKFDLESSFDPKTIAELIAKGLLLVENDRESKTLTIKLLCEPKALTEEQREELKKFMEAVIEEFNEFKKENNLSEDCMHIIRDERGNISSLRIAVPTLALYDAFIQRLANNLVPVPRPAKAQDEVMKERHLAPNPSLAEPEKLEEEQEIFNPSPFNMKPW